MNLIKKLLDINPFSRSGEKQGNITNIVVHWVGNANSSALANRNYFNNLKDTHERQASSHYIIDLNGDIFQIIPDDEVAFHSGDRNVNRHSIGIENCHPTWDGKFTEATYNSLIELVVNLCKKYNLTADNVIRHFDINGKDCPHYYVQNHNEWINFKKEVDYRLKNEVRIEAHIQDIGWKTFDIDEIIGTTGEGKRIEAIKIDGNFNIKYRVHVENIGWQEWRKNGEIAGTTGQSLRIEAIEIVSEKSLEVEEHIENVGWIPKSKGTEIHIGTVGKSLRLEAFRLKII